MIKEERGPVISMEAAYHCVTGNYQPVDKAIITEASVIVSTLISWMLEIGGIVINGVKIDFYKSSRDDIKVTFKLIIKLFPRNSARVLGITWNKHLGYFESQRNMTGSYISQEEVIGGMKVIFRDFLSGLAETEMKSGENLQKIVEKMKGKKR